MALKTILGTFLGLFLSSSEFDFSSESVSKYELDSLRSESYSRISFWLACW